MLAVVVASEFGQLKPFLLVHLNSYKPVTKFVTSDVGLFTSTIVGLFGPETTVQVPVPSTITFPVNIKVDLLQTSAIGPALAKVGPSLIEKSIASSEDSQLPLETTHLKL